MVSALEVTSLRFEGGTTLLIYQPGQGLRKVAVGVVSRRQALGLDEQRPARAQAAQSVVQARRGGHQFALGGAVQVRPAKAQGALERTVLV
ncbi:hypothetical protein FQZ97_1064710 [compost metagenome]